MSIVFHCVKVTSEAVYRPVFLHGVLDVMQQEWSENNEQKRGTEKA